MDNVEAANGVIFGPEPTRCPHDPPCRGLFAQCVTDWLQGPSIGSPESLRLGRLAHQALHPNQYCYVFGCTA